MRVAVAFLCSLALAARAGASDAAPPPVSDQAPAAGAPAAPPAGLSTDVLVARAQLLALKQDWGQAEQGFRDALEQDGERADAWRGLGYALRKQGRPADAVRAYEQATRLAPADGDALLGLGESYVAVGRRQDAEKILDRLRELDRRHAATLHHVITTGTPR